MTTVSTSLVWLWTKMDILLSDTLVEANYQLDLEEDEPLHSKNLNDLENFIVENEEVVSLLWKKMKPW